MKKWLKEPIAWLIVITFLYYGGVPIFLLATDKAEKQTVELYGKSRDVFVEREAKRIRIPPGIVPSVLFIENGKILRAIYLPPSRMAPFLVKITKDATCEEVRLFRLFFRT